MYRQHIIQSEKLLFGGARVYVHGFHDDDCVHVPFLHDGARDQLEKKNKYTYLYNKYKICSDNLSSVVVCLFLFYGLKIILLQFIWNTDFKLNCG